MMQARHRNSLGPAVVLIGLVLTALGGCESLPIEQPPPTIVVPPPPPDESALSVKARQEQQQAILKMHGQTLKQLYQLKPSAETEIQEAAGYAVFEVNGLNAVLSDKHGRGVVLEKATGKATFMQLARTDLEPEATLKPYRQILVFGNLDKLNEFVTSGALDETGSDPDIKAYRVDIKGLEVQANWNARYSLDVDLN